MYEVIKSIEISEELKINELYNLFKTNSYNMNLEIFSKLQTFSSAAELFKHYMNEDITIYYQKTDNFIQQLSSIIDHKKNKFDSKTDKYISDFSYILVLLNIISKLNESLTEILKNAKKSLSNIYEKYSSELDKSKQEKFSELIDFLLNKYSSIDFNNNNKSSNKFYMSKSSTKENSNGSLDHNAQYLLSDAIYENKEFLLGKENINNANKNNNSNFLNETPRFKNLTNDNPSSNNNNSNEVKNNDIDANMNSNLNFRKKTSFDSVFTLSQNINNNNNNNNNLNGNEKEKENIINKSINITSINNTKDSTQNNESNNLNDYITSIQKDVYFAKSSKRRQSCRFKSYKSNLTVNKIERNKSIDIINNVNLFSSLKDNKSNFNSFEKIKSPKFSSGHLFISNESKMYTDLFEIIIELYKSKKISLEQKLKLKKLIICKNPQILNVYKYFNVDNEKFVKQLKKIIQ
jgi:hypothetical protein